AMKTIVFILLAAISLSSCKKDDMPSIVGSWQDVDTDTYYKFTDREVFINSNKLDFKDSEPQWEYTIKGRELHRVTHSDYWDDVGDPLREVFEITFEDDDHVKLKYKSHQTDGNWAY